MLTAFLQVFFRVVNARAVVPQQRERVYFVGFRSDLTHAINSFEWPQLPVRHCTVGSILEVACLFPSHVVSMFGLFCLLFFTTGVAWYMVNDVCRL